MYRPPYADSFHDTCFDSFHDTCIRTYEIYKCFILRDFNVNILSEKSKSNGFSKRVRHLGLKQSVTVPTRTEARYVDGTFNITSTLIDHIYCSTERNIASIHLPPLSLSNHFPVLLVRRCNASSRQIMKQTPYNIDHYPTSTKQIFETIHGLHGLPLKYFMIHLMHSNFGMRCFKISLKDMYHYA